MAEAEPYIARNPGLTIGGETIECHMRKVSLLPEDSEVDTATFCKPGRRAQGTTLWTLEIDVLQSFGADASPGPATDGLYDVLAPLAKTSVAYSLEMDKDAAVGPDNPTFTGTVNVPSIPVIDAQIGDKSEFTLTFPCGEDPTKVTA